MNCMNCYGSFYQSQGEIKSKKRDERERANSSTSKTPHLRELNFLIDLQYPMGHSKSTPKAKPPTQDDIDARVHSLKIVRDRTSTYRRQQEELHARLTEQARQLGREGKSERAKYVLRQRILRAKLIAEAEAKIAKMEEMIANIATAEMNIAVIQEIDATNQFLKKVNESMSPEQVEAILDEHRDLTESANEVHRLVTEDADPDATQAAEDAYERMLAELGGGAAPAPQEEAYEDEGEDMVALPA
jgi:hypothetical protein